MTEEVTDMWVVEHWDGARWWRTDYTGDTEEEGVAALAQARAENPRHTYHLRRFVGMEVRK